MIETLVSIACISYNHQKYIRQTIEGFLMQKTNFPVEILIFDDASNDKTQEIIKEYACKNDNIITFLQKENQWSEGKYGLTDSIFPNTRGKYIALCEGDDYWTDPYKLQKQVDFLEKNQDFGLIHTNYILYIENKQSFEDNTIKNISTGHIFKDLILCNQIATLTVLVRKDVICAALNSGIFEQDFLMGDYPLWLEVSNKCKIGYLKDKTAVYRIHSESISNTQNITKMIEFNKSTYAIQRYFAAKYNLKDEMSEIDIRYYRNQLFIGFKNHSQDYASEAYSYLKSTKGYKIKIIDYLYVIGSKKKIIYKIVNILLYINKSINLRRRINIKKVNLE